MTRKEIAQNYFKIGYDSKRISTWYITSKLLLFRKKPTCGRSIHGRIHKRGNS